MKEKRMDEQKTPEQPKQRWKIRGVHPFRTVGPIGPALATRFTTNEGWRFEELPDGGIIVTKQIQASVPGADTTFHRFKLSAGSYYVDYIPD